MDACGLQGGWVRGILAAAFLFSGMPAVKEALD
jgi:hypothetical protein